MSKKLIYVAFFVLVFGLGNANGASPGDVSNPVLWLDASDIDADGDTNDNPADGSDVTIWADKSGYGNDAVGSRAPSYSTSAINDKAAVHFQPNEYLVGQNGLGPNITATVFIVGALHSKAGDSSVAIFSTQPSGGTDSARRGLCVAIVKESTVIKTDRGMTFPDNPVGLANPYLVVDVDTGNVDSNSFNIARFIDGGSNDLNGDIAEIIVYDCELSTADKNDVAGYLAQKYGLGSVNIPDRPTMTLPGLGELAEQNGCSAENCWCDGADLDYSGNVDTVDLELLAQSYLRASNAYYVAADGRDSNPGTEQSPWRTVQRAADTLMAGETVYIKEGTYNERVWVQKSGTPGNFITFAAYPGHTVTIDGTGIQFGWHGLFNVRDKSYIKVSGLRVINSSYWGIYVGGNSNNIIIEKNYTYNTASSGIAAWRGSGRVNCSDIVISGNEVELAVSGNQQECISLSGISRFEVRYNYVHHGNPDKTPGGEGIDTKDGCSNGKVYGNCVYRTYNKLGIYVDAWDEDSSNIEIFDNVVHECQMGFAVASEAGGELENIVFCNNLAYNNDTWGIRVNVWHDDSVLKHGKVVNNTFYNNNRGGIDIGDEIFENLVIRNNICSKNEIAQLKDTSEQKHRNQQDEIHVDHNLIDGFRGWWCEIYGGRSVIGDPRFVNPSLGDFHLKPDSPAIDEGSPIDAPGYDFEGDPRPAGSGYDIGIDEYLKPGNTNFPGGGNGGLEDIFSEDFESGVISQPPWTFGGDVDWFATTSDVHSGSFGAQAGAIDDSESTSLILEGSFPAGQISFARKISSESGFDFLRFSIDGTLADEWSGAEGWLDTVYPISSGNHIFEWTFEKDSSVSEGDDTALIDDVKVGPGQ